MFSTAARAAPGMDHARHPIVGREGDADDLAAALRDERLGRRGVGHLPGPLHVQLDHRAKALRRDRLGRAEELAAGVVDEQVEPPVALEEAVEERVDRLLVADVERLVLEAAARRRSPRRLLERLRAAPAADTLAPRRASSSAVARPSPVPAPETTQTCPSSRPGAKIRETRVVGQSRRRAIGLAHAGRSTVTRDEGPRRAEAARRAAPRRRRGSVGRRRAAEAGESLAPEFFERARPARAPEDARARHAVSETGSVPGPRLPDPPPERRRDPRRHRPPFLGRLGPDREPRPARRPFRQASSEPARTSPPSFARAASTRARSRSW